MLPTVKRISLIATIALSLAIPFSGQAALLLDGGFEVNEAPSWILGAAASLESSPNTLVNDTQALTLSGNDEFNNLYSVAYQHVAVDGVDFSIGDKIFLEGLIGHLAGSAMGGGSAAYIEIGFAFQDNDFNAVDFGNVAQSFYLNSLSATDVFINAKTTTIEIPSLVLGQAVSSIRVAVSFFQPNLSSAGTAWFDDLKLSKAPEPGTFALLFLGLAGISLARPKKA